MKVNELSNSGLGIEITDIDLKEPLNEKKIKMILQYLMRTKNGIQELGLNLEKN